MCLPAGLEAARDQPVLRLALVKRALGPGGVIAGALDAQLKRAVRSRAARLDLVGGGERERDLLRRQRVKQPSGDEFVDAVGLDRTARGGRMWFTRETEQS